MNALDLEKILKDIRIAINWNMINSSAFEYRSDFPVNEIYNIKLPWYRNKDLFDVCYNALNAEPLTVIQVLDNLNKLTPRNSCETNSCHYKNENETCGTTERLKNIKFFEHEYITRKYSDLTIPVFEVGANQFLALDKCHRTCALALALREENLDSFTVNLLILGRDPNRQICPDLLHYEK